MRCPEIEQFLENLGPHDYDQDDVSPETEDYNCIAFALGVMTKPWWPSKSDYYDWPAHLPREEYLQETLANFIHAFESKGYRVCRNGKLKSGIEKVAIYTIGGVPKHAARQLETGEWKSKCGDLQDIKHYRLEPTEGRYYGKVAVFMHRRRDGKPFVGERIRSWLGKFLAPAPASRIN
jgi:hypothetical protein